MKFNLICDESSVNNQFLVIGGITVPKTNYELLVEEFRSLKSELHLRQEGEIKWGKVSSAYEDKYATIAQWLFEKLKANNLTFRAHVIDTSLPSYRMYGTGDLERSFYKAYFHVLFQSICRLALDEEGSNVLVLLDDKRNRYPFHLPVMKRGLNIRLHGKLGISGLVANIEPRGSKGKNSEPLIQIVDLLIGAIAFVRNKHFERCDASKAKINMVKILELLAGTPFKFDTTARAPFNIFTFSISNAMERKREHLKRKTAPAPISFEHSPRNDAC